MQIKNRKTARMTFFLESKDKSRKSKGGRGKERRGEGKRGARITKSVPRFTTQDTHQKNFFYNPHTLVRVFYRVERYVLVNLGNI